MHAKSQTLKSMLKRFFNNRSINMNITKIIYIFAKTKFWEREY